MRAASSSLRGRERCPRARCEPIERRRRPHLHGAGIAIVSQGVELAPGGAPEHRHQRGFTQLCDLRHRGDAAFAELGGGHRPDAPQTLDRQRVQELELALGRHDEQTIGLGHRTGHLGQELRARDADRDRQPNLLPDVPSQAGRDLGRSPRYVVQSPDVEKRLIDGDAFHHRCRLLEDLEHRLTRFAIGRHAGRDDAELGAQSPSPGAAHRGSYAVGLGLVAGREHDATTHDDGLPAQPRVIALFDRGVERVEISMEDVCPD